MPRWSKRRAVFMRPLVVLLQAIKQLPVQARVRVRGVRVRVRGPGAVHCGHASAEVQVAHAVICFMVGRRISRKRYFQFS